MVRSPNSGRSVTGRAAAAIIVCLAMSAPAQAAGFANCSASKSPLWSQATAYIIEGRSKMAIASDMLVKNLRGWGKALREARELSRKGYDLKDQARRAAHKCFMAAQQNNRRKRSEAEKLNETAKRRLIREVKSKFPKISKYYNLGKVQWNLFQDRNNMDATLANASASMARLRRLPTQPISPSWSLSGSLLKVSTQEYQSIVTDSLKELEAALKNYDASIANSNRALNKAVKERRRVERSWNAWKKRPSRPRPTPKLYSRNRSSQQNDVNSFLNGFISGLAGAAAVYGATQGYQNNRTYSRPARRNRVQRRSGGTGNWCGPTACK